MLMLVKATECWPDKLTCRADAAAAALEKSLAVPEKCLQGLGVRAQVVSLLYPDLPVSLNGLSSTKFSSAMIWYGPKQRRLQ